MDTASLSIRRLNAGSVWPGFLAVVALSFAARALLLVFINPGPAVMLAPDSVGYVDTAINLLLHGTFADGRFPALTLEFNRAPGYAIFLMPFVASGSVNYAALLWVQGILGSLTAGLVYLAALWLLGAPRSALIAGLACGLDLVPIVYGVYLANETVFLLLWVVATALVVDAYRSSGLTSACIGGFVLSLGAFVRPLGLYYFIFAVPFLLFAGAGDRRQRALKTAVFVFAASVLPFGWSARNRHEAGAWFFATNGPQTFFYCRAAMMDMRRLNLPQADAIANLEAEFKRERPGPYPSDAAAINAKGSWSARYIAKHFPSYVPPLVRGCVKLVAGNGLKALVGMTHGDPTYSLAGTALDSGTNALGEEERLAGRYPWVTAATVVYTLYLAALYLFALRGVLRLGGRSGWTFAVLIALPALYAFALGAGPEAFSRIRIPAMPSLCLLAGLGAAPLRRGTTSD